MKTTLITAAVTGFVLTIVLLVASRTLVPEDTGE
jgi:hypothetical protein